MSNSGGYLKVALLIGKIKTRQEMIGPKYCETNPYPNSGCNPKKFLR